MKQILLAHGNGGRLMRALIHELILPALKTSESSNDASAIMRDDRTPMLTSDSFTVQPLFFPGGNIGSLAIHGTLNDLAVAGAEPAALTFNLIIEEGFGIETLRHIVTSAGEAVVTAGVQIVAGDTKVVPRGQGSGVVIVTTGLGWREPALRLGMEHIRAGDAILVSGPVGDHGATVLMAREAFGLSSALCSDAATVLPLARRIRDLPGLRFMRDPTRGGLATVMHEIACATGLGIQLDEKAIPIRAEVQGVCQLLGFNPLMLACEGRIVAVAAPELADPILARWREDALGIDAACIGTVTEGGAVCLHTTLGGRRFIDELSDDPLPRIC